MKALFSLFSTFALLFLVGQLTVSAQEPTRSVTRDTVITKTINGGIVNGKAVSMPHPEYPDAARQNRIGGVVGVEVLIDETGRVIFAEADLNDQRERKNADGTPVEPIPIDPMLREAAEKAAWLAQFSPTTLSGQPVKVRGKLLYDFVVDNSDRPPRVGDISGGLLNSRAISLPKPIYPDAAMAVKADGAVTVKVLVAEDGSVTNAEAISGHPLLRAAAEAAAREAKFLPTLLQGRTVTVGGVVTYNFVLPKNSDQ